VTLAGTWEGSLVERDNDDYVVSTKVAMKVTIRDMNCIWMSRI
jgi:hypothetical protein